MSLPPPTPPPPPGPPAAAGSPPPGLDEQALNRLRELDPSGSHGVLVRVLKTYEQSLLRMTAELRAARAAQDLETLGRLAHTLKSSSASVGALALSRCCAAVEQSIRSRRSEGLDGELDALIEAGELALDAVRAMLRA